MSKEGLSNLFELVKGVLEKEFGTVVREKKAKNGNKKIIMIRKAVVAVAELFGSKETCYNPHINVLIFERKGEGNSRMLSPEKLDSIRDSYRKALKKILKKNIKTVVVNYKYINSEKLYKIVWYVTKPTDPKAYGYHLAERQDLNLTDFMTIGLSNFSYHRFWGDLSNRRYKQRNKS